MSHATFAAVVIGASAGAFDALSAVLPKLPANYPLPILVVVHLPPDKKSMFAELLNARCNVEIREAEDKEPIRESVVYFAPPDYHMLVEADKRISLSNEEAVHFSRPSIDVLFESAADAFGETLIGAVLTGGSDDGAQGLKAIEAAGGLAIVQEPGTAYAATMPRAALIACPNAKRLTLDEISECLKEVAAAT
jgi:two-component system, chemotaxis family, protein-glutamate methylesterase/glutaminase